MAARSGASSLDGPLTENVSECHAASAATNRARSRNRSPGDRPAPSSGATAVMPLAPWSDPDHVIRMGSPGSSPATSRPPWAMTREVTVSFRALSSSATSSPSHL